ncbi:hypothetical protein HN587_05910 [Candidatus Woesearchaeota archaeon]|jgi:hypothetical protein|nr:hypothetical protein [Candidatus Woesearchaeota archaeon]
MAEGEFFVQIPDGTEVRRILLEDSKQIIQILQRYEQFKAHRIHKQELISKLRDINQSIQVLLQKLEEEMPKTNMRVKLTKRKKEPIRSQKTKELQQLEQSLADIERKISSVRK